MASLFDPQVDLDLGGLTRPGQQLGAGPIDALHIEQFMGDVEHALTETSVLANWLPKRSVQGTSTVQNFGIGRTKLGVLTPGEAPPANAAKVSKVNLTVDTTVIARAAVPLLEQFQTQYDVRQEMAVDHGEEMGEFIDQSYFIQAARASLYTQSTFARGGVDLEGHSGGNIEVLDNPLDVNDPAAVYAAISNLETKMVKKRADITKGGFIIALTPDAYKSLRDAEQITNGTYKTADGTQHEGMIFKAYGCPVVRSNNLDLGNVVGHKLSNADNGNAYDGDFTGLAGVILSPKALLAGETIPLQSHMWFNDEYKTWIMDSWTAYGVTPYRAEFAGSIWTKAPTLITPA